MACVTRLIPARHANSKGGTLNRRILLYIGIFLAFAAGGITLIVINNQRGGAALENVFNESTAFEVRYPDEWMYQIPVANVFVLAPSVVLNEATPGPSVTIQRTTTFGAGGDSLDVILPTFLENNNLTGENAENWEQVGDVRETEISGRPALTVDYRGSATPDVPVSWMEISVTLAESEEMVYFIFSSAPESLWLEFEDTVHAIVESIDIKE